MAWGRQLSAHLYTALDTGDQGMSSSELHRHVQQKTSYLSYWEPQLVLPHSALYYFSFPGPPPKGISENSYSKGPATTPLEGPGPPSSIFLCHCSGKPVLCFPVTRTLTRSCFKTFRNVVLCSSVMGQNSFLVRSAPAEKHSQNQM